MVECSEADCKEFVCFTDNCGGQNKNKFIAAMYLHAVRTLSVERICHIFLERGHTENEGDSVHATIERAARRANVYAPLQWYCRSGEEQSHKSPTPGDGPDEYRRAVKSILIYLENTSGI